VIDRYENFNLFFSRARRRAAYICIKRVKEWSNYNEQNLNLDQGEGCRGLMRKLLKKKKETMDLTTPQPANLRFIQLRYWLRGQVSRL